MLAEEDALVALVAELLLGPREDLLRHTSLRLAYRNSAPRTGDGARLCVRVGEHSDEQVDHDDRADEHLTGAGSGLL